MLAADGARGLGPIYGGRIVAGLGIGAASNLTPLYISEIAPPAIRGQLVGMYELGWQSGSLQVARPRKHSLTSVVHVQSVASSASGSTTA
jgi:MFS family permease